MNKCDIYTDGSYIRKINSAAWGCLIYHNNIKLEFCGKTDLTELWNIGAEIEAVVFALDWLEDNKIENATIHFDLINIGKWATGEWKRNKLESRAFYKRVQMCPINITWQQVKGHSDCDGNNKVDSLAGLGHKKPLEISRLSDIMLELYAPIDFSLDKF